MKNLLRERWIFQLAASLLVGVVVGSWSAYAACTVKDAWGNIASQCLEGAACSSYCGVDTAWCTTYSCNGYNGCLLKGGCLTECNWCIFKKGCDKTGC